ncbi:MAG TPA: AEC family transporter, partial [Caulobacterales bacterium]|nr:AEC family transporter [Caulobacterales bacterium]
AIAIAVLPTMLVVAIGYLWARLGRGLDRATLTPLVSDLGVPCLAFTTLARLDLPAATLGATAAAGALIVAGAMAVAALALRALKLPMRAYLPALTFPNAGNLGLTLTLSAFGPHGLAFAMIAFTIYSIANNTIGRAIAAGGDVWRSGALTPILPAVIAGVICSLAKIAPPAWLMTALSLIGGLALPLMLLMLGASLAAIKVRAVARAGGLSLFRLALGAGVGFAVTALFGFSGAQRAALILQSAMPAAVINYLFADLYKTEPEEIASLVVISTLFSVITTPLLLATLLR